MVKVGKAVSKDWAHFPGHIPATGRKKHPTKACTVFTSHGERNESAWGCDKCEVQLHVPDCY
jgi:hypothetical protein